MEEQMNELGVVADGDPLGGTVRALVAAVQRLAEENVWLRGVLASINVQVDEPDGGVLEMRVEWPGEDGPATAASDRAWLAGVLQPRSWPDQAAYATWLKLARALVESMGAWMGEGTGQ